MKRPAVQDLRYFDGRKCHGGTSQVKTSAGISRSFDDGSEEGRRKMRIGLGGLGRCLGLNLDAQHETCGRPDVSKSLVTHRFKTIELEGFQTSMWPSLWYLPSCPTYLPLALDKSGGQDGLLTAPRTRGDRKRTQDWDRTWLKPWSPYRSTLGLVGERWAASHHGRFTFSP